MWKQYQIDWTLIKKNKVNLTFALFLQVINFIVFLFLDIEEVKIVVSCIVNAYSMFLFFAPMIATDDGSSKKLVSMFNKCIICPTSRRDILKSKWFLTIQFSIVQVIINSGALLVRFMLLGKEYEFFNGLCAVAAVFVSSLIFGVALFLFPNELIILTICLSIVIFILITALFMYFASKVMIIPAFLTILGFLIVWLLFCPLTVKIYEKVIG